MIQNIDISGAPIDGSDKSFVALLMYAAIVRLRSGEPELQAALKGLKADKVPVEFKIAGVDVPFVPFLARLKKHFHETIEEKAREMFDGKSLAVLREFDEISDDFRTRLSAHLKAKADQLFGKEEEEDASGH